MQVESFVTSRADQRYQNAQQRSIATGHYSNGGVFRNRLAMPRHAARLRGRNTIKFRRQRPVRVSQARRHGVESRLVEPYLNSLDESAVTDNVESWNGLRIVCLRHRPTFV